MNVADSLLHFQLELAVECPTCGAAEYSPCVYVWPKGVRECEFVQDICTRHNDNQHDRLAKVGTPTKVAHNTRKHLVFTRSVRTRHQEELNRLSTWLRLYGDIFSED